MIWAQTAAKVVKSSMNWGASVDVFSASDASPCYMILFVCVRPCVCVYVCRLKVEEVTCTKCGISSGGMNMSTHRAVLRHTGSSSRHHCGQLRYTHTHTLTHTHTHTHTAWLHVRAAKQAAGEGAACHVLFPAHYQVDRVQLSTS